MDAGSSYLPSELNAAYLWEQLKEAEKIEIDRMSNWVLYYKLLSPLKERELIELPYVPEECGHNAHMFYVKTKNLDERTRLIDFLKDNGIYSVFHYIPLHTAPAGKRFGIFVGEDKYTTKESVRLIRLPMFYGLKNQEVEYICNKIAEFYHCKL